MTPADSSGSPVFISDATVRAVLDWPSMIDALRRTYGVPHGPAISPPRSLARGAGGAWMRTLTGVDPAGPYMGVKQFGLSRARRLNYLITLFDQETGAVVALLDGHGITALRTAATTAVAVDRMAPRSAATLGVLGSGAEAYTHVRAVHAVRPLQKLTVFSPNPERRAAFAAEFEAETGVRAVAVPTAEQAVRDQELVVGATRSAAGKPVIEGRWLAPETLLASIGATLPEQREVDPKAIEQAGIIVADVPEEVTEETGCFRDARAAGIHFDDKVCTLNALVLGQLDERLHGARWPMFRSVGGPLQDLSVATLAYQRALAAGQVQTLPIRFSEKS